MTVDETLNTPGPKKSRVSSIIKDAPTTPQKPSMESNTSQTPNTPTTQGDHIGTAAEPTLKNIQKTTTTAGATTTTTHQLIKIAPKRSADTFASSSTTIAGPKTAVKTANGQIIYIQKTKGVMSAVRLATSVGSTTGSSQTASSVSTGGKTVAIQVLRAADGTLVQLKSATASSSGSATKGAPIAISNKAIMSSNGSQVLIKTPLRPQSTIVSASDAEATTAEANVGDKTKSLTMTAAENKAVPTNHTAIKNITKNVAGSTATTGKIVVQSANGKHIVVSNPHLIKLSPNPSITSAGTATGTKSTMSVAASTGQMQSFQLTGKSGLQYVRVLPTTSAAANATAPATSTAQKLSIVRPAAATSMLLTQSPKKFSPITTKVQKTIVTVPTLRKVGGNKSAQPNNIIKNIHSAGISSVSLVPKHKISEINSEIQRMANQPEIKQTASGSRIVVMSRSMVHSGGGINMSTTQRLSVGGINSLSKLGQPQQFISKVPGSNAAQAVDATCSSQKIFSVLKTNSSSVAAAEPPHPVELKTTAELKSLIICGQAQAFMAQQQQHKSQMLHKQQILHQHQLQQLKLRQHQQQQQQRQKQQQQAELRASNKVLLKVKQELIESAKAQSTIEENVGTVRRKHCNCTKSQCLKLYCDCFANGEFCQDCNCKDCFNNLQYEDERQKAIKNCLERNPSAFKPKITTAQDQSDMRLHNKGCNCKRSGCLKNYCECYEAKIPCSSNCKCFGCRNIEDRPDLDMDPIDSKIMATIGNASYGTTMLAGKKRTYEKMDKSAKLNADPLPAAICANSDSMSGGAGTAAEKQQCNFITQEVIDATIQCMISQADECEKNGLPAYQTEKMVMEELGRCLVEIIDFSIRNTDTSYTQD